MLTQKGDDNVAILLDGKKLSEKINVRTKEIISKENIIPHLVAIQVGNNSESSLYISHKSKKAAEIGMKFTHLTFNEEINTEELINKINELNTNKDVDGIMIQLPLPKHIDTKLISQAIAPWKDVDGFHPLNKGLLDIDRAELIPPTAQGVIELFNEYKIDVKGKIVAMVGVGEISGKPLSKILLNKNATVLMLNKDTPDITIFTKNADIVIAAVGYKELIKKDAVKDESIIVNIGLTRDEDGIHGDVEFDTIKEKASYITPITGGTGPMTVSLLLRNTLICRKYK